MGFDTSGGFPRPGADGHGQSPEERRPRHRSNRLPVQVTVDGRQGRDGARARAVSPRRCAACAAAHVGRLARRGRPAGVREPRSASGSRADGLYPVFLSTEEEEGFYGRICNDSIWPLFHYFVGPASASAQDAWAQLRRRQRALRRRRSPSTAAPGRRVWVHDFHLMLVPEALRRRRPDLVDRLLPAHPVPVVRDLPAAAGARAGPARASSAPTTSASTPATTRATSARRCLRVLGIDSEPDAIEHDGRLVGIGVDPIGIDVESFRDDARRPGDGDGPGRDRGAVRGPAARPRRRAARLHEGDPAEARRRSSASSSRTPSAPRRRRCSRCSSRRGSRAPSTAPQRDEIELQVAHVNGRFGEPGRTPVEYLHREHLARPSSSRSTGAPT